MGVTFLSQVRSVSLNTNCLSQLSWPSSPISQSRMSSGDSAGASKCAGGSSGGGGGAAIGCRMGVAVLLPADESSEVDELWRATAVSRKITWLDARTSSSLPCPLERRDKMIGSVSSPPLSPMNGGDELRSTCCAENCVAEAEAAAAAMTM